MFCLSNSTTRTNGNIEMIAELSMDGVRLHDGKMGSAERMSCIGHTVLLPLLCQDRARKSELQPCKKINENKMESCRNYYIKKKGKTKIPQQIPSMRSGM